MRLKIKKRIIYINSITSKVLPKKCIKLIHWIKHKISILFVQAGLYSEYQYKADLLSSSSCVNFISKKERRRKLFHFKLVFTVQGSFFLIFHFSTWGLGVEMHKMLSPTLTQKTTGQKLKWIFTYEDDQN